MSEAEDKSIIPAKYRDQNKEPDWIGSLITKHCTNSEQKTDDDGKPVGKAKVTLDCEALIAMAEANGLEKAGEFRPVISTKNGPGRVRMSVGNMIRAAARRRGGIFHLKDGEPKWNNAPEEFMGDREPTEKRDGTKIAKKKAEAKENAEA